MDEAHVRLVAQHRHEDRLLPGASRHQLPDVRVNDRLVERTQTHFHGSHLRRPTIAPAMAAVFFGSMFLGSEGAMRMPSLRAIVAPKMPGSRRSSARTVCSRAAPSAGI